MMTAIHFIKLTLKLSMLIIMLPVILFLLLVRYLSYKTALTKSLIETGMPADLAKELARKTRPGRMFK